MHNVTAQQAASTSRRPVAARSRPVIRNLGIHVVLWVYAAIAFGPLLLTLLSSFRPNSALLADPIGLPTSFDVSNYVRAWTTGSFEVYARNSAIVTVSAVALCVVVSTMVAYPLGRMNFRGKGVLVAFFLSGLMLPIRLALVPIYYLMRQVGLTDSLLGLSILYGAAGIPFAVFILTAFFRQLPAELEEAAIIDGANDFQLFWRVELPLVRPALVTVVVFTMAPVWNDFLFALVLLRHPQNYTLPVGLSSFLGEHLLDRGAIFAGIIIALVPLAILFAIFMKQVIEGVTAGIGK